MRLGKQALIGAGLGFAVGVAFTIVSVFRYDAEETTLGEVVGAGLLIGVPVAVILGTLAGHLLGRLVSPPAD